jgi:hypothetical protein
MYFAKMQSESIKNPIQTLYKVAEKLSNRYVQDFQFSFAAEALPRRHAKAKCNVSLFLSENSNEDIKNHCYFLQVEFRWGQSIQVH